MNLEKILYDLGTSVLEASYHFEIWFALGAANPEMFGDIFSHENFGDFLEGSYIANQMAMLMALGRVFDKDTRASGIGSLKVVLDKNGKNEVVVEIETALKRHQSLVRNLISIRDTLVAHKDMKYSDSEIMSKFGITPNEIKQLISDLLEIIGKVYFKVTMKARTLQTGFHEKSTISVLNKLMGLTNKSSGTPHAAPLI